MITRGAVLLDPNQTLKVDGSAVTQPVSIAATVNVDGSGHVQPVSGTFWQATQPVSGSVAVSNLPGTQPVSGTVAVSNFPATQPVSGTFWQTTQPVSGTFWQATQPVSGTFWQAVQPVDGSGVTQPVSVAGTVNVDASAHPQPVTGTFWQATQPVSVATLPTVSLGRDAQHQPAAQAAEVLAQVLDELHEIKLILAQGFRVHLKGVA